MRFLLVGNYGVQNLGDEALKNYFQSHFPNVHWDILSAHPSSQELPRLPAGLRSFFSFQWIRTWKALRHSNGIVFGGGTLFTDTESVHACILWGVHAWAARMLKKPYFLAFQGVGPVHGRLGTAITGYVLAHATFISVRDRASVLEVQRLAPTVPCLQTFDPMFLITAEQKKEPSSKKTLVVIPRSAVSLSFEERVKEMAPAYEEILILSLQPGNAREQETCKRLSAMLGANATHHAVHSFAELVALLGHATFVLSQRYHGLLAALALGIPSQAVPQKEGDKLASLEKEWQGNMEDVQKSIAHAETALKEAMKNL